jgi:hypothetical protein
MEYTGTIAIFIIHYFQQIAACVKSKPDKPVILPAIVLNGTIVTRVHKRTANISFAFMVPKSRLPEFQFHVYYTPYPPTYKRIRPPADIKACHLYIWRECAFCISQNAKKVEKMKKLSAKTPAERAARGGKERGNPPAQPTSGMSACMLTLLGIITKRAYHIQ